VNPSIVGANILRDPVRDFAVLPSCVQTSICATVISPWRHVYPKSGEEIEMLSDFEVLHYQVPSTMLDELIAIRLADEKGARNIRIGNMQLSDGRIIPKRVGLVYINQIKASNPVEAMHIATQDAEYVSSIVSLVTGVAAAHPKPFLLFTSSKNSSQHHIIQLEKLDISEAPAMRANSEAIKTIASRIADIKDSNTHLRVIMSLRLYRRSQSTPDTIERFLMLWLATEYLDYSIVRKMDISRPKTCTKCGAELSCPKCGTVAGPGTTLGLRTLVEREMSESLPLFREAIRLRGTIMHGGGDLGSLNSAISGSIEFLVRLYSTSLVYILEDKSIFALVASKFAHAIEVLLELDGKVELTVPGPLQIDSSKWPQFEVRDSTHLEKSDDGTRLSEKHQTAIRLVNVPQGAKTTVTGTVIGMGVNVRDISVTVSSSDRDDSPPTYQPGSQTASRTRS